jgi:perosamine synthetase
MLQLDIDSIIKAIKSVISPNQQRPIALHEPCFNGNEWAYVKDCIDSTWVSYVGKYVDRFEIMLADFTGMKKAVAVVNGTAALHIALQLAGVKPGDEVLIPALTFVATANAVIYCGAVPHFVDSEVKTLGLDPHKLKDYLRDVCYVNADGCTNKYTGRTIKAVIPVHVFGHPVELDPLSDICHEYKLTMIEDAAESLGSFYKGRHTGHWGKLSILSFNGNKTITTGGGGAIITNDETLAKLAKHLTSTAKIPHRWEYRHDQIGYNYRLPNLNAALGCAQMEQLPGFLDKKRILAASYNRALQNVAGIQFFTEPHHSQSNYWLNALLLDEVDPEQRNKLLEKTNDAGIMTRPAWTILHKLVMFHDCPSMDLSCAEKLEKRLINIPSSASLTNWN